MKLTHLFLSGQLFPPLFLTAGAILLFLSRYKRYYRRTAETYGPENARDTAKMFRITGLLLILVSIVAFVMNTFF
jgi:hypothetical protein